jgi:hypothetical protein
MQIGHDRRLLISRDDDVDVAISIQIGGKD